MTQIPGTVFISHAAWRLARPDSAYDALVLPAHCDGDLIIEAYLGDRVQLACNRCTFEVSTTESRPSAADRHHESSARSDIPF